MAGLHLLGASLSSQVPWIRSSSALQDSVRPDARAPPLLASPELQLYSTLTTQGVSWLTQGPGQFLEGQGLMSSSFCTLTQWVRLHFSFEEARTWEGRQAGPGHRLFIGGLKPGSLTCNDPGLKNKSDREQKPQTRRKNALRPEFRLSSLRVPALPFQVDSHFCYCGISCHGLPRGTQVWRKKEVKKQGESQCSRF